MHKELEQSVGVWNSLSSLWERLWKDQSHPHLSFFIDSCLGGDNRLDEAQTPLCASCKYILWPVGPFQYFALFDTTETKIKSYPLERNIFCGIFRECLSLWHSIAKEVHFSGNKFSLLSFQTLESGVHGAESTVFCMDFTSFC